MTAFHSAAHPPAVDHRAAEELTASPAVVAVAGAAEPLAVVPAAVAEPLEVAEAPRLRVDPCSLSSSSSQRPHAGPESTTLPASETTWRRVAMFVSQHSVRQRARRTKFADFALAD